MTRRLAATVVAIRIVSAAMAYGSQVILARWMGGSEYGIYVYVWTWVLLLGMLLDFGIAASAQKLIPQYRADGDLDRLRGYLAGARLVTGICSTAAALLLAGLVSLSCGIGCERMVVPLYLGCLTLPAFVIANTQDGIARSQDWMRLGLIPQFIARQTLIIGATAGAVALGFDLGATIAMAISCAAVWIAMAIQMLVLNRRLRRTVAPGPARYDIAGWFRVSLPIVMVEGYLQLLNYTDVLVLKQFRSAEDVGVYFAVVKTLTLVSFIHYGMSAATAHRFAEYHATNDREKLNAAVSHAIAWTFWPSLAMLALLLALGKPILSLFGPNFVDGYGLMFIAAIGLAIRALVGPADALLTMAGQQKSCAVAYGAAFVVDLALCFALIPFFGAYGAAAAISIAMIVQTAALAIVVQRKLGLNVLAIGWRR